MIINSSSVRVVTVLLLNDCYWSIWQSFCCYEEEGRKGWMGRGRKGGRGEIEKGSPVPLPLPLGLGSAPALSHDLGMAWVV